MSGALVSVLILAVACNKKETTVVATATDSTATITTPSAKAFDINTVPVSDKELGDFPFFTFPQELQAQNPPLQKLYDEIYFPIDDKFVPVEGKSFKSYVVKAENSQNAWLLPYFLKSYDEAIIASGGVKIYDGKMPQAELDLLKEKAKYLGEQGSIDYWNVPVRTYLIRRANGNDVYVQVSGDTGSGSIQILQKEAFKQTITQIKSDQIQKDLTEKGKSVLHINFDTDKSTLKPDGSDAVSEIAKVLNLDKNLKLDINGYTDNTGDSAHNLQLSKDRANAVLETLVKLGIDKTRLNANGFGADNPISVNTSEDGKAQNRRVELVKK